MQIRTSTRLTKHITLAITNPHYIQHTYLEQDLQSVYYTAGLVE